MQEIEITISADGSVQVEGKGIEGNDCKALTKEIEAALGTVANVRLKAEYHRPRKVVRKASA
jgi:hypothetical protein